MTEVLEQAELRRPVDIFKKHFPSVYEQAILISDSNSEISLANNCMNCLREYLLRNLCVAFSVGKQLKQFSKALHCSKLDTSQEDARRVWIAAYDDVLPED